MPLTHNGQRWENKSKNRRNETKEQIKQHARYETKRNETTFLCSFSTTKTQNSMREPKCAAVTDSSRTRNEPCGSMHQQNNTPEAIEMHPLGVCIAESVFVFKKSTCHVHRAWSETTMRLGTFLSNQSNPKAKVRPTNI